MPTDLPPGYEHPDVRRQREAKERPRRQIESFRNSARIGQNVMRTYWAIVICVGFSLGYFTPKAKEQTGDIADHNLKDMKAQALEAIPPGKRAFTELPGAPSATILAVPGLAPPPHDISRTAE